MDVDIACSNVAKMPSFAGIESWTREAIDWFNQTFFRQSAQVAPQENIVPRDC